MSKYESKPVYFVYDDNYGGLCRASGEFESYDEAVDEARDLIAICDRTCVIMKSVAVVAKAALPVNVTVIPEGE